MGGHVRNCVVYFNTASAHHEYNNYRNDGVFSSWEYTSTTPTNGIPGGTGCITNDPGFVDRAGGDYRIRVDSPCRDTGTNETWMSTAVDLIGNPRIVNTTVDMGAYETPTLIVVITNDNTTVFGQVVAYDIGGTNSAASGTMIWTNSANGSNGALAAITPWVVADIPLAFGENTITVFATNDLGGAGSDNVVITRLFEYGPGSPIHYAATNGANVYPYTNWTDAAVVIQDAVDAASSNDTVLVTNGVYDMGGTSIPGYALTNRVVIDKAVTVESVNGPGNTFIVGAGPRGPAAVRCVYLTNGAVLAGMTLTNGHTFSSGDEDFEQGGGGALLNHGGTLTNCVVTDCEAQRYGGGVYCYYGGEILDSELMNNTVYWEGGGARLESGGLIDRCIFHHNEAYDRDGGGVLVNYNGLVRNSLIYDNTASSGAGAYLKNETGDGSRLYNCTVADNAADFDAGGVRCGNGGHVRNCVIYFNTADTLPEYDNYRSSSSFATWEYNCLTPLISGKGNITNAPVFIDSADDNYRLMYGSPCIDSGTNLVSVPDDLDGIARPLDGNYDGTNTTDMGCYEYDPAAADSDGDGMDDTWEHGYGLNPTNAADANQDSDGDHVDNGEEYVADTVPTNAASYFHITSMDHSNSCTVTFACTNSRVYSLEMATNVAAGEWLMVEGQTNVTGDASGGMSLTDTNAAGMASYRVGVQVP